MFIQTNQIKITRWKWNTGDQAQIGPESTSKLPEQTARPHVIHNCCTQAVLQLTLLAVSGVEIRFEKETNKFYSQRSQLGVWHKSTLGYCLTSHLTQSEGVRGNPSKVQDFRQCCHPLCAEKN